jgi:hypothetical protein
MPMPSPTPTTWKTKDGREILISDLTNDHLINIICFLRKRYDELAFMIACKKSLQIAGYISSASDGAAMAAEQEMEMQFSRFTKDAILCEEIPAFNFIFLEVLRRNINLYSEEI